MRNRKIFFSFILALLALAVILGVVIFQSKQNTLSVIFLDVGQGDAILISSGSQQVLIDGGKDGKLLLEKLGKYIPFWDRNIETVLETHPDQDHIGGLVDVLKVYKIGNVFETKMQNDSQIFRKLEETIVGNKIEKVEAKKDVMISFSNGATLQILYPIESIVDINSNKDTNAYSVVAKLTIGKSKFLLTGDFPTTQDNLLLNGDTDVSADFLKVSHHGSKYATSEEFLSRVKPTVAIISVGKKNSYGHPNQETLQRLMTYKVNIFRTDESGDLEYVCRNLNEKCWRVSY